MKEGAEAGVMGTVPTISLAESNIDVAVSRLGGNLVLAYDAKGKHNQFVVTFHARDASATMKDIQHMSKDLIPKELQEEFFSSAFEQIAELYKENEGRGVATDGTSPPKEWSPETKENAFLLSKDSKLLGVVLDDISKGHVGDDKAKLLIFILYTSSHLEGHEQSVILQKASSAGGSDLQNTVLQYFDNLLSFTRITSAAPDRSGFDFSGRILKVEELAGMESSASKLRVMLSEGNLTLWTTAKDENGNIKTEQIHTRGTPSMTTSTTDVEIEPQLLGRFWIVSIDETEAQTRRVIKHQASKFSLDYHPFKPSESIQCLVSKSSGILDRNLEVIIPYEKLLGEIFPAGTITARRDSLKFFSLIAQNAWLHQNQRPRFELDDGRRIVLATKEDFKQVMNYAPDALKNTLFKLNDKALRALETIVAHSDLTYQQLADDLHVGTDTARRTVHLLDNQGLVTVDTTEKTHKVNARDKKVLEDRIEHLRSSLDSFGQKEAEEWLSKNFGERADGRKDVLCVARTGPEEETKLPLRADLIPKIAKMLTDDSTAFMPISKGAPLEPPRTETGKGMTATAHSGDSRTLTAADLLQAEDRDLFQEYLDEKPEYQDEKAAKTLEVVFHQDLDDAAQELSWTTGKPLSQIRRKLLLSTAKFDRLAAADPFATAREELETKFNVRYVPEWEPPIDISDPRNAAAP